MFAIMSKVITLKQKIKTTFGSQAELARLLGEGPMTVSQWFREGRRVPAGHCRPIVEVSAGSIGLHELRPDLYPAPGQSAA